ncbi:hypothetical protein NM208_g5304 [Fusarium decemcellulare]|uniref:Uncharacterized protein n=1 Tax=Fusarium decemcellulare TaxID=57161 RepID=A0ACC1SHF9_9HYPO|nr:hypothetical protein NM208_g5304 [Fusarium decemcellulare]
MAKQWNARDDTPDLHGKVALVTGASGGVGLQIVGLLARRGAKVYLTSRTKSKAQGAKDAILNEFSDVEANAIDFIAMDLTILKSIETAVQDLIKKEKKLDILINNASVSTDSTELAGEWEQHMAANLAGPFILVNRLLPLLKSAAAEKDSDVRIVSISSTAQTAMLPADFKFQFDTPTLLSNPVTAYPWSWRYIMRHLFGFDIIRYSASKASIVLFIQELQRRWDEQGIPILALSVHPGEVNTESLRAINGTLVRLIARLSFLTPEQGATSPIFAATAKEVRQNAADYKGKFLEPVGKISTPNPVANDVVQVMGLWENTTIQVNKKLASEGLPSLAAW